MVLSGRRAKMNNEANISFQGAAEKNLRLLSKRACELAEARILELSELCEAVSAFLASADGEGLDIYEMLALVREGVELPSGTMHSDPLYENIPKLSVFLSSMTEEDKVFFSALLLEHMEKSGIAVSERSFISPLEPSEIFTYVRNAFSDEAYDVFSVAFENPRVKYCSTLKDAVRAVADGEVGYALLPLEERGARISTVDELIYRNDLKITAITPVFGQDADMDLKYALVARSLGEQRALGTDDRYLEIRLSKCTVKELSGILFAAELFCMEIYRLGTVRFGREDGNEEFYTVIFRSEGCDFTRMLTYLALFTEDFVAVGMYKNLE